MAHEELKKQYQEDCKKYERPWELWEYKPLNEDWHPCGYGGPAWWYSQEYRRKEPPFQPEYFSGLNWREAKKLVGKLVEGSYSGDIEGTWHGPFILKEIMNSPNTDRRYVKKTEACNPSFEYIRTTPETFTHPTKRITVNGKTYKLPMPEKELPKKGTTVYLFDPTVKKAIHRVTCHPTEGLLTPIAIKHDALHLTEERAQAWADFWKEITA